MEEKIFNSYNSKVIKGLGILLMLIHHLFAFNNRISNVEYISIINTNGTLTLEYYIAVFARICVPIYLFVGGYGLYYKYSNESKNKKEEYNSICKRIVQLLKVYWVVFIIFIPMGIVLGKIKIDFIELIKNIFTLSYSYNAEWWFLNTYILLLLLFPLIKRIIAIANDRQIIMVLLISYVVSILSGKILSYDIIPVYTVTRLFMQVIAQQTIFIMGCIFCKLRLFDKLHKMLESKKLNNMFVNICVMAIVIIIRTITFKIDIILLPIFIYSALIIINGLSLNKLFKYLGDHSTNLWLTHSFFCYYYFQKITFMPMYSILIIIWLLLLCLISSYLINLILYLISRISLISKTHTNIN